PRFEGFRSHQIDDASASQPMLIGPQILRRLLPRLFQRLLVQLDGHGSDDAVGHFILDGEDIGQFAVVAFGPDMVATRGVNELGRYAHALTGSSYAALEHIFDAQFPSDGRDVDRLTLVEKGRVASNNREVPEPG